MKLLVSICPCLASPSCLPLLVSVPSPPSRQRLGRSRVEGQKRKFILPEPPALFHTAHWVCVCVCVKKVCWQVPVRQESRTGKRGGRRRKKRGEGRRRRGGLQTEERKCGEIEEGRSTKGPRCPLLRKCFHLADDWWQVRLARVEVTLSHCHWGVKHWVHPAAPAQRCDQPAVTIRGGRASQLCRLVG